MNALSAEDRIIVTDDIFAVAEAVLELYRNLAGDVAPQKASSPKFAKLVLRWARRPHGQLRVVINLVPDSIDVLDAVATALVDIEARLRIPVQVDSH